MVGSLVRLDRFFWEYQQTQQVSGYVTGLGKPLTNLCYISGYVTGLGEPLTLLCYIYACECVELVLYLWM